MHVRFVILSENKNFSSFLEFLGKKCDSYRIITDNIFLHEFLEKEKIRSHILKMSGPQERESIAVDIYKKSKDIQAKYAKLFENLTCEGINVFECFEYIFLFQLMLIEKIRILLQEQKETVIVFTKFSNTLFGIKKLVQDLGYDFDQNICFLNENKKEFVILDNIKNNLVTKSKGSKTINFVKDSMLKDFSIGNIKTFSRFTTKASSFKFKETKNKIFKKSASDMTNTILKKVEKRIVEKLSKSKRNCGIFVTGVRLDLYVRPIIPVLDKFDKEKTHCHVITDDLATELMMSKEKIPYLSFFEEINFLTEIVRQSSEWKNLPKKINDIIPKEFSNHIIPEMLNGIFDNMFRTETS